MDSVFAGLQSQPVEVENEDGEHYRPADNVNEIGTWNSKEAYVVYTEADATLSIQGESLESRSVELEQGWNWVPYIHDEPLPVEEALSSIADALVLVKGEEGRAYAPDKGIEVLETMEPGEGYKVYVSESVTLTYPGDSE
jgi:hypothetical protein